MSETINNNQKEKAIGIAAVHTSWPDFKAEVIRQTVNCVTIDFRVFNGAAVYKIEKFHKRHGWEQVQWCSSSPISIGKLDENFGYRLRILALQLAADGTHYELLATSPDVIASTEASLPSTNALHRAIRKGQQFLVKRMLRRRPSLIEHPGPNGFLPLANAIIQGEMCIIDVLLSAGCSVHIGNPHNGRTPLHLAFYHGHLTSARILLNKKAQLEATDCNGMTSTHCAVDANQLDMLKFALESGANTEARDNCGWTLLLRAVIMNADLGMVKLLVMHGADLSAVDGLGQNSISLAKLYHRTKLLDYLNEVHTYRQAKAASLAEAETQQARSSQEQN